MDLIHIRHIAALREALAGVRYHLRLDSGVSVAGLVSTDLVAIFSGVGHGLFNQSLAIGLALGLRLSLGLSLDLLGLDKAPRVRAVKGENQQSKTASEEP